MKKRILIFVIVLVVVVSATGGGVYAYGKHKDTNTEVKVAPAVDMLSDMGYSENGMQTQGYVTNDLSQEVKYEKDKKIVKIYVNEGDQVKIDDPLVEYDLEDNRQAIEAKELTIQRIQNQINLTNKKLNALRALTPLSDAEAENEGDYGDDDEDDYSDDTLADDTPADDDPVDDDPSSDPVEPMDGDAYNYISTDAKSYDKKSDGSEKKPFRFLCTKQAYVLGSYLNYLRSNGYYAVFEVRKGNKTNGALITSWMVNGSTLQQVDDDVQFSVSTKAQIDRNKEEEEQRKAEEEEQRQQAEEERQAQEEAQQREARRQQRAAAQAAFEAKKNAATYDGQTYSQTDLADAIKEAEKSNRDADLELRKANLELEHLKKEAESGVVKSTINGTVKKVQDPENVNEKKPLIEVSGSDGLYVSGTINELLLDKVEIGQTVTATNEETNESVSAKITDVSKYPVSGNDYYGEGNPNASYYPFTAYIEDATNVHNGDYVDLNIDTSSTADTSSSRYLDGAFIRKENAQYYVMVRGKDKRLEKRYVQTGKKEYGSVEIKAGLKPTDYIAFPYGKNVKEGARTKEVSASELFGY